MIPIPSIERLAGLIPVLDQVSKRQIQRLSSAELAELTGIPAHTLRRDISLLDGSLGTASGYDPTLLTAAIEKTLGLSKETGACVVGLGLLGQSLLNYSEWNTSGYVLKAGFDSDVNTVERISSRIPCFPAYEIPEMIGRLGIRIAILAVPAEAVGITLERLIKGGIKAVLNFAPVFINPQTCGIPVRNMHLLGELRVLSTLLAIEDKRSHS